MDKNEQNEKNEKNIQKNCHSDCSNSYDDGNIPVIDVPQNSNGSVEPLPESTRPRKDGPGGD